MTKIFKFLSKESTLKVLTVILALTGIVYIESLEWNRTTAEVETYMIQIIQSDNSFLAQSR